MQCPKCGEPDLLPKFKWCPLCSCPLPWAQNVPRNVEHGAHGVETTFPQSSPLTRDNDNLGLDNRSIQGNLILTSIILFMVSRIQVSGFRFDF